MKPPYGADMVVMSRYVTIDGFKKALGNRKSPEASCVGLSRDY
ncbi:hypothetical protein [Desulfosporosinus orientis]|nr:hypothetical protein [Desulfosporosinus orientis]